MREPEAGRSTEHGRIADAEADGGIGNESQGVGLSADDHPRALKPNPELECAPVSGKVWVDAKATVGWTKPGEAVARGDVGGYAGAQL